MKIVAILGDPAFVSNADYIRLVQGIQSCGHSLCVLQKEEEFPQDADVVLGVGGDGTFLGAARLAAKHDIPVMGVNFGRLGFLSENTVDMTIDAFRNSSFKLKERAMLSADVAGEEFVAVNEIVAHRTGPAMLGVRITIGERTLPTYWGDGLIIATASGSTAYNLSVGGPIVLPSSKVFLIAPIAPHNLNVRPLVIPDNSRITMEFVSRDAKISFSADNQSMLLDRDAKVNVSMAQFSLKRLCLEDSSFIKALSDKLYWGEDKRNEK